jgi:hypothetical protein
MCWTLTCRRQRGQAAKAEAPQGPRPLVRPCCGGRHEAKQAPLVRRPVTRQGALHDALEGQQRILLRLLRDRRQAGCKGRGIAASIASGLQCCSM